MNYDGKVDYWEYFKDNEKVKFAEDNDRDGKIDEWGILKNGHVKEQKWSFQNDKIIDKKAIYKAGRKIKGLYNRDRDGNFDEEIILDEFERIIEVNNM